MRHPFPPTYPTFNSSRSFFVWLVLPLVLGQLLFCVATRETTSLVPVFQNRCLISRLLYVMHKEGIRNWETVRGFNVTWYVASVCCMMVVSNSVVLCVSKRVEESPVDTRLLSAVFVCHFALATLWASLPFHISLYHCSVRNYGPLYWFKNPTDRKTFQIIIVWSWGHLQFIIHAFFFLSRYSTFE